MSGMLWYCLFLLVGLSIHCPIGGVFLSVEGNDSSGDGSSSSPFRSFERSISFLHLNNILNGVICLFQGTYNNINPTIASNFHSLSIISASPTSLPYLSYTHFKITNTTLFHLSQFQGDQVVVETYNSIVTISDILGDASSPTSISVYGNLVSSALSFNFGGILHQGLEVSCDELCVVSIKDSVFRYVHLYNPSKTTVSNSTCKSITVTGNKKNTDDVVIENNTLGATDINLAPSITISDSSLHSYIFLVSKNITMKNCSAANLNLNSKYNSNFISIYQPLESSYVNLQSLHIANITLHTKSTDPPSVIRLVGYTFLNISMKDSYFSCNSISVGNRNSSLPLFIGTSLHGPEVTLNFVNNVMDQTCAMICPIGNSPIDGGLACDKCLRNFVSPDGKGCIPCPPGTDNTLFGWNCSNCSIGKYNPFPNSSCDFCSTGTPNLNSTFCIPCPTYFFSRNGTCYPCGESIESMDHIDCQKCSTLLQPPKCTTLSTSGHILIGFIVGTMVILSVVCFGLFRRKDYTALQQSNQ